MSYVVLSDSEKAWLDNLIYTNYVFKNSNFIFPFGNGTISYLDLTQSVFFWSTLIDAAMNDNSIAVTDRTKLATIKLRSKALVAALIEAGINLPAPLPNNLSVAI